MAMPRGLSQKLKNLTVFIGLINACGLPLTESQTVRNSISGKKQQSYIRGDFYLHLFAESPEYLSAQMEICYHGATLVLDQLKGVHNVCKRERSSETYRG